MIRRYLLLILATTTFFCGFKAYAAIYSPDIIEGRLNGPGAYGGAEEEPTIEEKKNAATAVDQAATAGQRAGGEYIDLGSFKLTAYCGCRICNGSWTGHPTAIGSDYVEGRTIAVDRRVIPLGSIVEIFIPGEGWRQFRAEDTGSAIKGNKIDIYVGTHSGCYNPKYNGYAQVRIVK